MDLTWPLGESADFGRPRPRAQRTLDSSYPRGRCEMSKVNGTDVGQISQMKKQALTAQMAKLEEDLQAVSLTKGEIEAVQRPSPALVNGKSSAALKKKKSQSKDLGDGTVPAVPPPPPRPKTYRQGLRCICGEQKHRGVIQYVGSIASLGPGVWVGVQLDEPVGNSNGHLNGRHLFDCPAKFGGFFPHADVQLEELATSRLAALAAPAAPAAPAVKSAPPPAVRGASLSSILSSTMSSTHSDGYRYSGGSTGGNAGSPAEESIQSSPAHCVAAGRGLQTAVVQQLSQFVITAYDEFGHHCQRGGEPFAVFVHGVKPPCKLRSKLVDHGDGHYTGEYKAEVSGELEVAVTLRGVPIAGSPFTVQVVTLQPHPARCVLRGDALHEIVARQPSSFDLDFVDALGHPAVAEELDLRVEPVVPLQVTASDAEEAARLPCSDDELAAAAAAFEQRMNAQGSLQLCLRRAMGLVGVDMNGKSDPYTVIELVNPHEIVKSKPKTKFTSTIKAKTLNPVWNENFELKGTLTELVGRELLIRVFDCENPTRPEKDDLLGETSIALDFLRTINSREFTNDLTMKGKVVLEVIWMSPEIEISVDAKFMRGDDRVIIGNSNLILRQGFSKSSTELLSVPPETWVQLHEVRESEDGWRAHVRVVSLPSDAPKALQEAARGKEGWLTAAHKDGRKRLARRHLKLENVVRQRQMTLWGNRMAAEHRRSATATAAAAAGGAVKDAKQDNRSGESFVYELKDCPRGIGLAYGGLYPGMLQTHGELVRTHQVSYSVGKAGKYLLHVGLRGQSAILPGSPFMLEVVPGPAHAPSTAIPANQLPLRTVVGTTGRLVLVVNDNMGNPCNTRSVEKHTISMEVRASSTEVKATCDDPQDGTMVVTWTGEKAGSYLLDILIDGEHVVGSPATIEMCPAEIEVGRCEVVAPREAVCGQPLKLELHLRDPYGNHVLTDEFIQDETSGCVCGIVLLPSVPKADGKKAVNKASKAEIEERLLLTPSVAFKGEWRASTFHISYVPTEAGECETHVWMDLARSGQRTYLPGSPFPIRVQTGRPSASGSVVADVNLVSLGERLVFPAGDRLQVKVQLRDEFGNPVGLEGLNAGTLEGPLRATLQNQNGKQPLTLKQAGSTKDMALGLGDASTQGEKKGESKKKGDTKTEVRIGMYELVSQSELLVKGTHVAHILLNGAPIGGSPIEFTVTHSNAVAQKSFLECSTKAPTINWPCEVLLHLVDRYGNACERGDVRVEAKVFGSKASDVETTNRGDGIYTLTFTTYVPGDYKVSVRLENVEMAALNIKMNADGGSTPPRTSLEEIVKGKNVSPSSAAEPAPKEATQPKLPPQKAPLLPPPPPAAPLPSLPPQPSLLAPPALPPSRPPPLATEAAEAPTTPSKAKGSGGKKGGVGAKKGGKAKGEGGDAERATVAKTPKGSAKKDDTERAAVAKTPKGSAKRDDAERAAVAKTPKGSAKKDKGDPSAKPEPASAAAAGAASKSKSASAHKVKKEKNGAQFTQELSQNYPGQEPLGLGAIMSAGGGTSGGGTAAADSAASEPPAIPPTAADQSFAAALAAEYVRQREYLEKTSELAALRERLAMVEASEQLKTDRATADLRAKVLARGF